MTNHAADHKEISKMQIVVIENKFSSRENNIIIKNIEIISIMGSASDSKYESTF